LRIQLRPAFQRLAYLLPRRWQLELKIAKRAILRQPDWAIPIKQLRLQEQSYLQETGLKNSLLPQRRRILILSMQIYPPWLDTELALGMALRLRGHKVQGILCDGLMPICELNLGLQMRPPCGVCVDWISRYEKAFGFNFFRLTDFITKLDLEKAEELVRKTQMSDLPSLVVSGVNVGKVARLELQRYYRGFVFDPLGKALEVYRKWLVAGVLMTWLFERILDREEPDILISSSGKTLLAACANALAKKRATHVVTWDTSALFQDGIMFRHDEPADDVNLDDVWGEVSQKALSNSQEKEIDEFMRKWSRSEITPFSYNPMPLENETLIRTQLGLRPESPLVIAYTNTSWDMAVVDRDIGFESMYDWVFSLVQYAIDHPKIDLIVRAHPAEKKTPPILHTTTPVVPEIKKRFESIPNNIKFIEGDNPISSYTLASMAQVVMLYASMLGLELAMRGIRPWIAGNVNYRGKGFTLDLVSKEQMFDLLENSLFSDNLSKEEVTLAKKFAHLWIFRHLIHNPFVDAAGQNFRLESFRKIAPGGNRIMDDLCEALVSGQPFIDIGHAQVEQ
jgi:hypothetical protein